MTRLARISILSILVWVLPVFAALCAEEGPAPLYVPTSGWLVGPASLAPASGNDTRMPCIMMTQYDNGYTFRFSGGGKRILAAAIDFRQSAFTAGTHYPLTLEIPPSFSKKVDGVAYNEAILMVTASGAQDAGDLYKALAESKEIRLGLGKKFIDFALLGASDGLRRIEECYSPLAMRQMGQDNATQDIANSGKADQATPPVPSIDTEPEHGSTGQTVDSLLGKAAEDVSHTAAAPAIVDNPAAKSVDKSVKETVAASSALSWQVAHGANLRDTLEAWAKKGNVSVNWMAAHSFSVRETIRIDGSFEQAVQSLLAQLSDEKNHPVAGFYTDPDQKKRVLLIKEAGG